MTEFHPLFPPQEDDDEDADAPDIQEILIQRKEDGKWVSGPRVFMPGELTGLPQLFAEFGGGEYQLIARNSIHRIVRRNIVMLPGPKKPMFDTPEPVAPKPVANPMMAMMGGGGGEGGIMGLVMMMMQQMMQSQQQAAANQSQMMMAFIQTMATGNQAQIQAAQESMNRQSERDARDKESQMAMLIKLTEARQSGNSTGGEESFFKGVEFMRHFATQQVEVMKASAKGKEDFDWESLLESGLQALQTFNAFKDMGAGGLPGAPVPTEVVQ
jgi:hypothetical protein